MTRDSYRLRPDDSDEQFLTVYRYRRFQSALIVRRRERSSGLWIRYGGRTAYLNPRQVAHEKDLAARYDGERLF
jgi:hypothetical protein